MNIRNFKFEENPSCKNALGFSKIYHEVILLRKLLQTEPQVRNMNIEYYDFFFTVIENRDDKRIVK